MANTIEVVLSADPRRFIDGLTRGERATQRFGRSVTSIGSAVSSTLERANRSITAFGAGLAASGVALGAGLASATRQAADFETNLRNINTIAGLTDGELAGLGSSLLDMSRRFPQSANQLAEGLYDIQSSGFAAAEGTQILEAAATAATAGLTDTATASGAIVAALNAYGLSAADAVDVSDILFQTVNLGVVTFEELAAGVGEFVGVGAAAGVELDEMAAALATMTTNGVPASQVSVSLARAVQSFITPSTGMTQVLNQLGFASGTAALQQLGLQGAIEAVNEATGGNITALSGVFDNVNALQGVLALTANEGETYARIAGEITDESSRAGAAQAAFAEQAQTLNAQLAELRNGVQAIAITIGTTLLPAAGFLVEVASKIVAVFDALPGPIKTFIAAGAAVSSMLAIVGGALIVFQLRSLLVQRAVTAMVAVFAPARAAQVGAFFATPIRSTVQLSREMAAGTVVGGRYATMLRGVAAAAGVAGKALAAFLVGTQAAESAVARAEASAGELGDRLRSGLDTSSIDTLNDGMDGLRDRIRSLRAEASGSTFEEVAQFWTPWGRNEITEAEADLDAVRSVYAEAVELRARFNRNVRAFADQTGIGMDDLGRVTAEGEARIVALADSIGVDLTGAAADVVPALVNAAVAAGLLSGEAYDTATAAAFAEQALANLGAAAASFTSVTGALDAAGRDAAASLDEQAESALDLEERALSLERAQRRLADVEAELQAVQARSFAQELAEAELDRTEALLAQADAEQAVYDAELNLQRVREAGRSPRDIAQAERDLERARIASGRAQEGATDAEAEYQDVASGRTRAEELDRLNLERSEAMLAVARASETAAAGTARAADAMTTAAATLGGFGQTLADQLNAQNQWEDNLFEIVERGAPLEVVDQLVQMGADGAGIVEELANTTDEEFDRIVKLMTAAGRRASSDYTTQLQQGLSIAAGIARRAGADSTLGMMEELNKLPGLMELTAAEVQRVARSFGFNVLIVTQTADGEEVTSWNKPTKRMAAGGITGRAARIASTPILWAEAGREAYIPLSHTPPSMRTVGILQQAAGELGFAITKMADGGLIGRRIGQQRITGASAPVVYLETKRGDVVQHVELGVRQNVRDAARDLDDLARRRRLTHA